MRGSKSNDLVVDFLYLSILQESLGSFLALANLKLKGITHISGREKSSMKYAKSIFENALETATLEIDAPKSVMKRVI